MTASLARPAHWDDPDPVPGFRLQQRRADRGVGTVWTALAPDGGPVLIRLVQLADDAVSRAKAGRLARALPLLAHPDLDPVRQVVPTVDGLALVRPAPAEGMTTLSTLLTRRRSLSVAEVAGLADRLGRALGYLHDNGVTHGRLTAGDMLLAPTGRPVLTGFGVAGIQGAGGLPAEDVATLASLLLSMLPETKGLRAEPLREVLATVASTGDDGHAFADAILGCCDPAPIRLRPSPARLAGLRSTNRSSPTAGPDSLGWSRSSASPARSAAASPTQTAPEPGDTLDAAVRALRAGVRHSGTRQRGRPRGRASRPAAPRREGQHVANRKQRSPWLWRIAPAGVLLLVTILVGWRFLGPAATADARPVPAAGPAPDRATITRLDAARSAAFAAGATNRLTEADAPGSSALAVDRDAMSIMLSHQGRARGFAPRLFTVTLLSRKGDRAVVRVVDELPPYDFVTPAGQIIARSAGHLRQAHDVRLRLVSGQWRYEAVTKPPAPVPSSGGAS
jgi:hypothetical protein